MENRRPALSFPSRDDKLRGMQGDAPRDVLKVWLYVAASVLVGAWATPLVYNAGKALAEVSAQKETNGPLEWLADRCREAAFPSFFEASLLLTAAVFFVPLIRGLGGEKRGWQRNGPDGFRQFAGGFLRVNAVQILFTAALAIPLALHFKNPGAGAAVAWITARALFTAAVSTAIQEILFRGIALGIFLRAMRPGYALALSALLFAFVKFLQPLPGMQVIDPDAAGTGFEMLGKIAGQLADPRELLGVFVPLLGIGCVLAAARLRTASLGLPLGLHAGWYFSKITLSAVTGAAIFPRTEMWMFLASIFIAATWSSRSAKKPHVSADPIS